jgi:hypothetical protein
MQRRDLIRQLFLGRSTARALLSVTDEEERVAIPEIADGPEQFFSKWHLFSDMQWTGEDLWAHQSQDFCIRNGELQCLVHVADRTVLLLTHQCSSETKSFSAEMTFRFLNEPTEVSDGKNVAGFRLGIEGRYDDCRFAITTGKGIHAGITRCGHLFIDETFSGIKINETILTSSIRLVLVVTAQASGAHFAKLKAMDHSGNTLATISTDKFCANDWKGNIALMSHFEPAKENRDQSTISVSKFIVKGEKLHYQPQQTIGAVYFVQHTIDNGLLSLTAQLAPLNLANAEVQLLIKDGETWKNVGTSKIHPETNLAIFRIENWDIQKYYSYKVACHLELQNGNKKEYTYNGEIVAGNYMEEYRNQR